jgi:hypothetical protein
MAAPLALAAGLMSHDGFQALQQLVQLGAGGDRRQLRED